MFPRSFGIAELRNGISNFGKNGGDGHEWLSSGIELNPKKLPTVCDAYQPQVAYLRPVFLALVQFISGAINRTVGK